MTARRFLLSRFARLAVGTITPPTTPPNSQADSLTWFAWYSLWRYCSAWWLSASYSTLFKDSTISSFFSFLCADRFTSRENNVVRMTE